MEKNKRLVISGVLAICMSVFACSSIAIDLGQLIADKLQVSQQKQEESKQVDQQQSNETQTTSTTAVQTKTSSESNAAGFCDKVQSTEVYQKYAKLTGDAVRGGYPLILGRVTYDNNRIKSNDFRKYNLSPYVFDSEDKLLLQWVRNKHPKLLGNLDLSVIADPNGYTYFWDDRYYPFKYEVDPSVGETVEKCFDQVLNTDFAYVFLSPDRVEDLRKEHDRASSQKVEIVREVSGSGEVVEKKIILDENPSNYEFYRTRELFMFWIQNVQGENEHSIPPFPHWLTLFDGGEKVLNVTGAEYLSKYESALALSKRDFAERAKNLVASKAALEQQAIAYKQNIERIKKGDFSKASSCKEIADVLAIPITYFQAAINPPIKPFAGSGSLVEHTNNSLGGSEEVLERGEGRNKTFAKLRIVKSTLVIGAKDALIGQPVSFIGTYASNSSGTLTNGATVQIPVFNATCVHYGAMSFLF